MTLVNALYTLALAQATGSGSPAPKGAGDLITIGGPLLMFLVIYLLLIRPAGKQRREHQAMLTALKKDDEVITTGGIVGKIVSLDDRLATVEIADKVKVRVLRERIASRYTAPSAAATSAAAQSAQKK
jgi:preprotein translocase subunit YajC